MRWDEFLGVETFPATYTRGKEVRLYLGKPVLALVIIAASLLALSTLSVTAHAFNNNACNSGTMNAHESGIPSSEPGEHDVPGLAHTPFAGSEVPGHDHVPECG